MRNDQLIRNDIECGLQWDPSVDDKKIGVFVDDGVVTLTGEVNTYNARSGAEDVAKHIGGVRAIANEIMVRRPLAGSRSDSEIASAAANALQWNVASINSHIKPVVCGGRITLTGHVHWDFQRQAAEYAVSRLAGVTDVINSIAIMTSVNAADLHEQIDEAFRRHGATQAMTISVTVSHAKVTLEGHVDSWWQHQDAARTAAAAPGIDHVENLLSVRLPNQQPV